MDFTVTLWSEPERPLWGGLFHSGLLAHGSAQVNQLQIATVTSQQCAELSETWWKSQKREKNPVNPRQPKTIQNWVKVAVCPEYFQSHMVAALFQHPFSQRMAPKKAHREIKPTEVTCDGLRKKKTHHRRSFQLQSGPFIRITDAAAPTFGSLCVNDSYHL